LIDKSVSPIDQCQIVVTLTGSTRHQDSLRHQHKTRYSVKRKLAIGNSLTVGQAMRVKTMRRGDSDSAKFGGRSQFNREDSLQMLSRLVSGEECLERF